jgi:uncharacterized protein YdeI (YjbR/CyaY-like superfamily)
MDLQEVFHSAHSILNQAHVDHALIGGFDLSFHGVHRATGDIDFLIISHKFNPKFWIVN